MQEILITIIAELVLGFVIRAVAMGLLKEFLNINFPVLPFYVGVIFVALFIIKWMDGYDYATLAMTIGFVLPELLNFPSKKTCEQNENLKEKKQ